MTDFDRQEARRENHRRLAHYLEIADEEDAALAELIRDAFMEFGKAIYDTVVDAGILKNQSALVRKRWLSLANDVLVLLLGAKFLETRDGDEI